MGKRRGRPKKNLPLRDKGTPELIIKRMQLVQGGDPSLSTTPIDICYARKIISAEQYNAGLVFLYLHRSIFGKPFPISNKSKLMSPIGSRYNPNKVFKKDVHNWIMFKDVSDFIIKEAGSNSYKYMKNVIVYQEQPPYLLEEKPNPRHNKLKIMLHVGLNLISDWLNQKKRR